jgi:hypothetical protein
MRHILIIVILALIVGCSTKPVALQSVPDNRIYEQSYNGAATEVGDATIIFFRDSGLLAKMCNYDIHIDNVKVFSIRPGETIVTHVPAGPHSFRLDTGGARCSNISILQKTIVTPGETQTYRILVKTPKGGGSNPLFFMI